MTINKDTISGKMKETKGQLREKWGQLTHDAEEVVRGNAEQLEGKARQAYGETKEAAKEGVIDTIEAVKKATEPRREAQQRTPPELPPHSPEPSVVDPQGHKH